MGVLRKEMAKDQDSQLMANAPIPIMTGIQNLVIEQFQSNYQFEDDA